MFEQHLYSDTNYAGIISHTSGFDTVACSDLNLVAIGTKYSKYLSADSRLLIANENPKLRYTCSQLDNRTGKYYEIVGQSVFKFGRRSSFIAHQFISEVGSIDSRDVSVFAGYPDFIETFDDSGESLQLSAQEIGTNQNFIKNIHPDIIENHLPNLIYDVYKAISDNENKTKIYISLPVSPMEQTEAAIALLQNIYSFLPSEVRHKLGYNTMYLGSELYLDNIQIYFVPSQSVDINNVFAQRLNLSNEIIYDFSNERYHQITESVPKWFNDFYYQTQDSSIFDIFSRLKFSNTDDTTDMLSSLENFWKLTDGDISTDDSKLLELLNWIKTGDNDSYSEEYSRHVMKRYVETVKLKGNIPGSTMISYFISNYTDSSLTIELIRASLDNSNGDMTSLTDILIQTRAFPNLFASVKNLIKENEVLLKSYIVCELRKGNKLVDYFEIMMQLNEDIDLIVVHDVIKQFLYQAIENQVICLSDLNADLLVFQNAEEVLPFYTLVVERLLQTVEPLQLSLEELTKLEIWLLPNYNEVSKEKIEKINGIKQAVVVFSEANTAKELREIDITVFKDLPDIFKFFNYESKTPEAIEIDTDDNEVDTTLSNDEFKLIYLASLLEREEDNELVEADFWEKLMKSAVNQNLSFKDFICWLADFERLNFSNKNVFVDVVTKYFAENIVEMPTEIKGFITMLENIPFIRLSKHKKDEIRFCCLYEIEKAERLPLLNRLTLLLNKKYQGYKDSIEEIDREEESEWTQEN